MRQTKNQTIGPVSEFLKERKFQYEYSEGTAAHAINDAKKNI